MEKGYGARRRRVSDDLKKVIKRDRIFLGLYNVLYRVGVYGGLLGLAPVFAFLTISLNCTYLQCGMGRGGWSVISR